MKTEFTHEQTRVLANAVREANPGTNRWIPEGCANTACRYHDASRCKLNNYQRQSCDTWQRPANMPSPTKVTFWLCAGLLAVVALLVLLLTGCSKPERLKPEPVVEAVAEVVEPPAPAPEPPPVVVVTQVVTRAIYYAAPTPVKPKSKLPALQELRAAKLAQWQTERGRRWHSAQDNQVRLRTMNGLADQIRALDIQIQAEKAKGGK